MCLLVTDVLVFHKITFTSTISFIFNMLQNSRNPNGRMMEMESMKFVALIGVHHYVLIIYLLWDYFLLAQRTETG